MAYGTIRAVEKTTIYLDRDLRLRLATAARRTGLSQAAIIRDAVQEYLGRVDHGTVPSWVGAITDAPVTDAATIKRELRPRWLDEIQSRKGEGGS